MSESDGRRLYARIQLHGGGCYTQPLSQLGVLVEEIQGEEAGATWTIELVALTEAEYEALPDFGGH